LKRCHIGRKRKRVGNILRRNVAATPIGAKMN
jgi:hypothetical protein